MFAWPSLALFAALALAGIWLARRTGFPAALGPRVANRQRFLYPMLAGLGFGLLSIVLDLATGGTSVIAANTGNATFNIAFPGSLFAYTGGAILVETLYRIFTLPFLLWLISSLLLLGRGQSRVFWGLAIILAAWELVSPGTRALGAGASVASGYAYNLAQNVLFRRYGFLASFTLRIADYLLWNVAYGNFICQC